MLSYVIFIFGIEFWYIFSLLLSLLGPVRVDSTTISEAYAFWGPKASAGYAPDPVQEAQPGASHSPPDSDPNVSN